MPKLIGILLVALTLEAVGVVLLSEGLRQIGEIQQYSVGEIARIVGRGVCNSYILLGVLFETVFFIGLLIMLKTWDVSLIWPLTSLGFVLTTLAAKYIRHENVSALRWSGVLLIMIGASLVGWSEKAKEAGAGTPKEPIAGESGLSEK
jgi:drug/metabolite transporter (DMT)-like permease